MNLQAGDGKLDFYQMIMQLHLGIYEIMRQERRGEERQADCDLATPPQSDLLLKAQQRQEAPFTELQRLRLFSEGYSGRDDE